MCTAVAGAITTTTQRQGRNKRARHLSTSADTTDTTMAIQRAVFAFAFAILATLCIVEAAYPDSNTVANKFIVTWNIIPGGLGQTQGFYSMPRTISEATDFEQALDRTHIDNTTVWCRKNDYRVCVLFDLLGSVAGIQVSHSEDEVKAGIVDINMSYAPQWFVQMLLGTKVFSCITYFVDEATLKNGGRKMDDKTLTAPNGIRILENRSDFWLSTLDVPLQETAVEKAGFVEQNCFMGMGKHYFLGLDKETKCDKMKHFFTLFGHDTKTLHGFGVLAFGKFSKAERSWFEQPASLAIQIIAPNHPKCLLDWVKDYTLNTIHVFFVDKPWKTTCGGGWF